MKDMYGNEYVRPTACSHSGCPPWQCILVDPAPLEPPVTGAELRKEEKERIQSYRDRAASSRSFADSAPTPALRDSWNQLASDNELMAEGRETETVAWKKAREREHAIETWRAEVKQARSGRLLAGGVVGIILGVGFLVATYGEAGQDLARWLVALGMVVAITTCLVAASLNFLFGLPKRPMP